MIIRRLAKNMLRLRVDFAVQDKYKISAANNFHGEYVMKKRIIGLILVSLLLSSFISACGEEKSNIGNGDTQVTETVSPEDIADETTAEGDKPDVMNADYEGAAFNVLYPNGHCITIITSPMKPTVSS